MSLFKFTSPVLTERSALRVYDLDTERVASFPTIAAEVDAMLDHRPEIIIFGKVAHQNRSVGFFSDTSIGYRYSGKLARSKPMTESLRELLAWVNGLFGAKFNGILINKYDGGEETIGKHSDDEKLCKCGAIFKRNLRMKFLLKRK